ncbi:MAG TPA: hypothetical protein VIR60_01100 [Gammaproteobacteria bacterium]
MKTSNTALTLALATALGSTGAAFAGENPFGMQVLEHGYQVAEADAKMPDGKCGAKKVEEGKCAANKVEEGKCAANKADMTKAKDGKCGEGKCGANKDKPAETMPQ